RLELREKSTNLECWLIRAADKKWIIRSMSPFDRATLSFISEEDGWHVITVTAQDYTTSNASYRMIATLNSATDLDRERIKAEALLGELDRSSNLESLTRASQQLEESLKFWAK